MLISFTLMALVHSAKPSVEFIDSKINDTTTWILINEECPVSIDKKDINNFDMIVKKVNKVCDMDLKVDDIQ